MPSYLLFAHFLLARQLFICCAQRLLPCFSVEIHPTPPCKLVHRNDQARETLRLHYCLSRLTCTENAHQISSRCTDALRNLLKAIGIGPVKISQVTLPDWIARPVGCSSYARHRHPPGPSSDQLAATRTESRARPYLRSRHSTRPNSIPVFDIPVLPIPTTSSPSLQVYTCSGYLDYRLGPPVPSRRPPSSPSLYSTASLTQTYPRTLPPCLARARAISRPAPAASPLSATYSTFPPRSSGFTSNSRPTRSVSLFLFGVVVRVRERKEDVQIWHQCRALRVDLDAPPRPDLLFLAMGALVPFWTVAARAVDGLPMYTHDARQGWGHDVSARVGRLRWE